MILPQEKIHEVIQGVVDEFLIPKFQELGMHATGDWEASLEVRTSTNRGEIWGPAYTKWLVEGRGPNKDQSHEKLKAFAYYYGMNVIKPWAEAKGIEIDNPIAVAYHIGREGTSRGPAPELLEVLESEQVQDYILKRVGGYIIDQVIIAFRESAQNIFNNGN